MKLALIAGNRALPIYFARLAKKHHDINIVAFCFNKETDPSIKKFVDKTYWIDVGKLQQFIDLLKKEKIKDCVMVGQISPYRIFKKEKWDSLLVQITKDVEWRPHCIFTRIITHLEKEGFTFLPSTLYMEGLLAQEGVMNQVSLDTAVVEDVEFGARLISRYVELDVGQTLVVKNKAVVALEALEGTDRTIKRAYSLAGRGCIVLKFSKKDQDVRFDIPVVGMRTLSLIKKIHAKALALEAGRVIILDKEGFLRDAEKHSIAVLGIKRFYQ